jgi:hypothetical protein
MQIFFCDCFGDGERMNDFGVLHEYSVIYEITRTEIVSFARRRKGVKETVSDGVGKMRPSATGGRKRRYA